MLRDQALFVSGLLVEKVGGPSVKPYQPSGVWAEATFGKKKYVQDRGDKLYRRSVYTFWRRIVGPTIFFDVANRRLKTFNQASCPNVSSADIEMFGGVPRVTLGCHDEGSKKNRRWAMLWAGALETRVPRNYVGPNGFVQGDEQTETVRQAIRWLTGTLPVVCLLVSVQIARGYPLTREAHEEIVRQLEARGAAS